MLNNFRKTLRDDKDSRKPIGRCQVTLKKRTREVEQHKKPWATSRKY
jgi:hypothetical protein